MKTLLFVIATALLVTAWDRASLNATAPKVWVGVPGGYMASFASECSPIAWQMFRTPTMQGTVAGTYNHSHVQITAYPAQRMFIAICE